MGRDDEDEFWQVAFENEGPSCGGFMEDPDLGDDEAWNSDNKGHVEKIARAITYKIPWRSIRDEDSTVISLKLSPLPDADGIWSPLGAQAWHASSLFVAYALQSTILKSKRAIATPEREESLLSRHIESWFAEPNRGEQSFTALELGSGAVGLAGIVMGLILAYYSSSTDAKNDDSTKQQRNSIPPRVILTDNEANVVKHLQFNVDNTLSWLANDNGGVTVPRIIPDLQVQHLDWNHYQDSDLSKQTQSLQLVFGSELVYTGETAKACANIVLELLVANPGALVFILQVTDRDGWTNEFLPTLSRRPDLQVLEETMVNSDLHALAGTIIPPGGTLDRFAFGGCYIFHTEGRVANITNCSS